MSAWPDRLSISDPHRARSHGGASVGKKRRIRQALGPVIADILGNLAEKSLYVRMIPDCMLDARWEFLAQSHYSDRYREVS